ncbi:transcription antitermination factor NusB [Rhodothalassium salexigens]|uniref:transcription antitermination factor NusB n=1 Tax=Rhodothalassium salexigens TaxID=1086 RepID=UPI00191349EE
MNPRSAARLAAVQALYQLDMDPTARARQIVTEFKAHRLGREVDGQVYARADEDFFGDLVEGAHERRAEIDAHIAPALDKRWPLHRLERLMACILRAATYELAIRADVPRKVVINEYLNVAHAFYSDKEPRFINGVLETVADAVRGGDG